MPLLLGICHAKHHMILSFYPEYKNIPPSEIKAVGQYNCFKRELEEKKESNKKEAYRSIYDFGGKQKPSLKNTYPGGKNGQSVSLKILRSSSPNFLLILSEFVPLKS